MRWVVQVRLDRGLIAIVARECGRPTTLINTINAIHRREK